jgi:hypothetical protein
LPWSPPSTTRGSIGTSPRNSTPSSSRHALAAALAEDVVAPLVSGRSGGTKYDMFSTMPSTGTLTFSNIARPLRASISERSLAVVTITAPESGACWVSVSAASPVPGGRSTTR